MMTEKKVDVGDEEQVKKRKTKKQIAREREVYELGEILATYGGRATIWRILTLCVLQQAPPGTTNDTFRHIGKQDVGRRLLNEVFTSAPDVYTLMRQEAQEREEDG